MKAFSYVAFTKSGRRKTGSLVAESERSASAKLKEQGLFPETLTEQASRSATSRWRTRLDADTRMVFTRQMAVLLGSELSVEAALDAVIASKSSAAMQNFATRIKASLLDGYPLSDAIQTAGGGFAMYYVAAIRAGETSGELTLVFEQLADYLETAGASKAQVITALVYPAFVSAVALVACAVLVRTIAPELASMFETIGKPLPRLTVTVLGIADWVETNWGPLVILATAAVVAFILMLRYRPTRDIWDNAMLRLPVVGRAMRLRASAQYLRTLALVLGSRQTVLDAVTSAADVLSVTRFRREAEQVIEQLRQGQRLSTALEGLSPLPPVTLQLLKVGEDAARLARMADRSAILVENSVRDETKRLTTVLEPILMMLVGLLVLTIVLAILLPIFDLQASIG